MAPCPRLVARQPSVGQGRGRRCAHCGRTVVQSCLRALPKQLPLLQSALSDGESDSESSEDTPGLGGDRRAGPGVVNRPPPLQMFNVTLAHLPAEVWTSMAPAASACRRRSGRAHRHRHHRHRRPRPAAAMRCGCTATDRDDCPTSGPTTKPPDFQCATLANCQLEGGEQKGAGPGAGATVPVPVRPRGGTVSSCST